MSIITLKYATDKTWVKWHDKRQRVWWGCFLDDCGRRVGNHFNAYKEIELDWQMNASKDPETYGDYLRQKEIPELEPAIFTIGERS